MLVASHDLRDGRDSRSGVQYPSRAKLSVEKFDIDWQLGFAQALCPLGLTSPQTFAQKNSGRVGINPMTDIRAAHGIRSILAVLLSMTRLRSRSTGRVERRVMKQMAEKYGPIVYKKVNLRMAIIPRLMWSPI